MAAHTKQPTLEQLRALQRFANRSGRSWKAHLIRVWQQDSIGPDAALLRQVRNEFGPAWLQSKRCHVKPAKLGELTFVAEVKYNTKTTFGTWRGIITAPGASTVRDRIVLAHKHLRDARSRATAILSVDTTVI